MFVLNYPCPKAVLSPRNKYIIRKTYTNAKLKYFPFANNASYRNTLQTSETEFSLPWKKNVLLSKVTHYKKEFTHFLKMHTN